ncbi:MAG: helix-turn-helix transcriptional regulator [Oscillospiraceae bacterium]|nr:helix-turn-helix transcriptional regulator [Oscillospiraceae bacterium]
MKQLKFYISKIRKQKGLSAKKLSEKAGISSRVIDRIEAHSVNPRLETMCKLADALEVPITDLFSYE